MLEATIAVRENRVTISFLILPVENFYTNNYKGMGLRAICKVNPFAVLHFFGFRSLSK